MGEFSTTTGSSFTGGGDDGECGGKKQEKKVMEGMASIAMLPDGSISGHFIHLPNSACFGLHGHELACERECSRGEDFRLIKLTIIDYNRKKHRDVVVECKGHDAARFNTIDQVHGWENDVVNELEQKQWKNKIFVSFECQTLKAEKAAEDHLKQFLPKLVGLDAVVNIGPMTIKGLHFEAEGSHGDEEDGDDDDDENFIHG
ncbi:hypothetical protein Droror1_Dr00016143 [Drosera rotundifolia]